MGINSDAILDKMIEKSKLEASSAINYTWISSFDPCGEKTARIILSSSRPIRIEEAVKTVQKMTNNRMNAFAPSFQRLPNISESIFCASIHGYLPNVTLRPVTEELMSSCYAIEATTYMDSVLGNIWERKEIDGNQFLVRHNEDDPQEVLQTALLANTASHSRLPISKFSQVPQKGDYAIFFACEIPREKTLDIKPYVELGQVLYSSIEHNAVNLDVEVNGYHGDITVPPSSLVAVIQSSALDESKTRKQILDFLQECYGDEYGIALKSIKNSQL